MARCGLVSRNVCDLVEAPRSPRAEARVLSLEQAARRLRLGLVVCGPDGRLWPPDSFSAAFGKFVRRAGLGALRFHDLRHTHASQLRRAGVGLKTVSARLGHRTAVMRLDVYGHVLPGAQEEAARVVDEILGVREHGADRHH